MTQTIDKTLPEQDWSTTVLRLGKQVLEVSLEEITPDKAREYLAKGEQNYRKFRERHAGRLARDIKLGNWVLTGETVTFDGTGDLVDGQHRLTAVIQADRPLVTLVVRGVSTKAVDRMDTGLKRNLADVLRRKGVLRYNIVAAVLSRHWRWVNGVYRGDATRASVAELLTMYEGDSKRYDRASAVAMRIYQHGLRCGQGTLGLAYLLCEAVDEGEAAEFFALLEGGENLPSKSPLLSMRRLINRHMTEPGYLLVDPALISYLIKAWNYWRDGIEIEYLQWSGSQAIPEPH